LIIGANRAFDHDGREYHLQAEDLGEALACFEVRVYQQGAVLWNKRVPYAELLERGLPRPDQDDALRDLMQKTLHTVQAAIVRGKLG
jgi:hypothetical protein